MVYIFKFDMFLTSAINLSIFFPLSESHENAITDYFFLCFKNK